MTAPDSFATSADATAYGFTLPASADGLLARATQALRDAAGSPITQTTSTLQLDAHGGRIELPTPLITSLTSVAEVTDDGTTPVTDFTWRSGWRHILLGRSLTWQQRNHGRFELVLVHGFAAPLPAALVMLTAAVAYRLSATPPGAAAGLKSKTVGSVSWTAGETPGAALTSAELCSLARIMPVQTVWQVPV